MVVESQPSISPDVFRLLNQSIEYAASRLSGWDRSLEEVKLELELP